MHRRRRNLCVDEPAVTKMPAAPAAPAAAPLQTADIQARLHAFRQSMQQAGVQAALLPSSDPHLSEYLPERWQGRQWLSGFTGSSGTLLVGSDRAALFTDSRYWEQAEKELAGTGIELVKLEGAPVPAYTRWLADLAPAGAASGGAPPVLGMDGEVLGLAQTQLLTAALQRVGWSFRTDVDLLDQAWPGRPALPDAPIVEHRPPHATSPRADKLATLRQALREQGATHHWIATLDDLAWLFNLRGSDVDYNPVFLGHALIDLEQATLFVRPGKIHEPLLHALSADGVNVRDYELAHSALQSLPDGSVLLLDPKRVTWGQRQAVPSHVWVIETINPTTLSKSRKTDAEATFVREAMERDGAAMCAFYAWLEQALGREEVSELTIDERLTAERARQPDYVSLSFPTIAGFNANGALPHYRATPGSHAILSTRQGLAAEGLLLIDSGAQYLGGTTDITRVWPVGVPTAAQRRDFTLVLKGTIALSRTRFPKGTLSPMLDAIARAPLWAHGLDFGHGTGHGVGYFLNVHEGPQSISKAIPEAHMALHTGMITSIEPGLYRPGQWGIRIENLVLNVPVAPPLPTPAPGSPDHGEYLAFETLSLCPIDTRCIDLDLLGEEDRRWLNGYHGEVRARLQPHVQGDARAWLEARTAPI